MLYENVTNWLCQDVQDFKPGDALKDGVCYRFRLEWDDENSMADMFAAYTADPLAAQTRAIVIGSWFADDSGRDSAEIVELLVGARHSLPNLEGIFFGDIISEENEISWINQADVSPLLAAYPALKHLVVRGGNGLSLGGRIRHEALESLVIQTGGLPVSVLREVLSLDLPKLETLELWLGTANYGWDGNMNDLAPLLQGGLFPALKHLGLRDSEIADAIAEALVTAPVVHRLESLDLSLGTLSDAGAQQLLKAEALKALRKLDLHHHYCSDGMMQTLREAFPNVNLDDQQKADEYGPYVAVGE